MKSSTDLRPALNFLSELRENNNKAWFDRNRASYEEAKESFEDFVAVLISKLGRFEDMQGVLPRDCIFRINRDIRFSKDKTPYKTNLGADIKPGGKRSDRMGYYVHLQPGNKSMLAGGLYMPTSPQLAAFRQAIDRDAGAFKKVVRARGFVKYFGELDGERLTTAPQGYPRDHPEIRLLQLKQVTVGHSVPDRQVLAPDFPGYAVQVFKAMKPFLDYLNGAVQQDANRQIPTAQF